MVVFRQTYARQLRCVRDDGGQGRSTVPVMTTDHGMLGELSAGSLPASK